MFEFRSLKLRGKNMEIFIGVTDLKQLAQQHKFL